MSLFTQKTLLITGGTGSFGKKKPPTDHSAGGAKLINVMVESRSE